MKLILSKICIFISASAAIILNVSSDRKGPILSCILVLVILAVLIALFKKDPFEKFISFLHKKYFVVALLICSVMGCNFYSAWVHSWRIDKFSYMLGFSNANIVLFCSVLGVIVAIPSVVIIISCFSQTIYKEYKKISILTDSRNEGLSMQKSFCAVTVIFLIGISAIIRANFNYIDDMGRVLEGYRGWDNFSRFVSNGLSTLIHMDNYITDISPLPQFMAILILALTGIILLYIVYERTTFSLWELVAIVPLGLNPYFLECISYKFDAPFMALSILAAIAPLLLRNGESWEYILAVTIGNILVCTTYQAAVGVFPMVVILLSLRMCLKNRQWKEIFRFVFNSIIGFVIGVIFFRQVIMIPADDYVSNALPSLRNLFPTIVANFKQYVNLLLSDHENLWKWIIVLLVIAFFLSGVRWQKQRNIFHVVLPIIAGILMFLLCFGLYPALEKPLFDPRAMYGFGVFITLLCISTAENFHWTFMKLPVKIAVLAHTARSTRAILPKQESHLAGWLN